MTPDFVAVEMSNMTDTDIVLQDSTTVVRYSRETRQLQLRRRSTTEDVLGPAQMAAMEAVCPGCGRPYPHGAGSNNRATRDDSEMFLHRNYFKVLAEQVHSSGVEIDGNTDPLGRAIPVGLPAPSSTDTSDAASSLPESAYNQGYYQRFFVEQEELGRGARGRVYKVTHVLDDIQLGDYAVKKVAVGDNHAWLEKMLREVHVLRLRHRNLINFHHVWLEVSRLTQFGPPVPTLYLLQEFASDGDLEKYILTYGKTEPPQPSTRRRRKSTTWLEEQPTQPLPVAEILSFTKDIVAGLNYLHQNGIIHRDLKPSNCLLSASKVGSVPRVLVGDFGEGQLEGAKRAGPMGTGTVEYSAPETVVDGERIKPVASAKLDMFSLGMVLHFICFLGKLPYLYVSDNAHFQELRDEVRNYRGYQELRTRSDLPSEIHQLLELLLSPNPDDRPSAKDVLQSLQGYWKVTEETHAVFDEAVIDSQLTADSARVLPVSRRLTGVEDNFERPAGLYSLSLSSPKRSSRITHSRWLVLRSSNPQPLPLLVKSIALILLMHNYPTLISTSRLLLFAIMLSLDCVIW